MPLKSVKNIITEITEATMASANVIPQRRAIAFPPIRLYFPAMNTSPFASDQHTYRTYHRLLPAFTTPTGQSLALACTRIVLTCGYKNALPNVGPSLHLNLQS